MTREEAMDAIGRMYPQGFTLKPHPVDDNVMEIHFRDRAVHVDVAGEYENFVSFTVLVKVAPGIYKLKDRKD